MRPTFGRKGGASASAPPPGDQHRVGNPRGSVPLSYDVSPHPLKMALGIALFGTGVLVFLNKLLDPRGVVINGIIHLGPVGANVFYSVLLLLSLGMTGVSILGFVRSFGEKTWITLDRVAIYGPKSYNSTSVQRFEYRTVQSVNLRRYQGKQFIEIRSGDGRKMKFGQANFRVPQEWPDFLAELDKRLATR